MTDFPPPAGFPGSESCEWGEPDETYERECTPEEIALLDADAAAAREAERAEDEALRDSWLAMLKEELGVEPAAAAAAIGSGCAPDSR